MNKALLAALSILTVTGCGPLIPDHLMSFDTISVPDAGVVTAAATHDADDAWATGAFALYGKDAVHTCLAAFHQDVVNDNPGNGEPGKSLSYRAQLADFMCNCARGQSAEGCPEP
jgi:hypothetical protein